MQKYNHKKIEKKWQDKWDKSGIYKAEDFSKKPKYYCLIEFPYPSGAGLHVGHLRSHIAIDIVARQKRMSGYNVIYPIGWDAFGLPTENFAIKTKMHPRVVTENNVKNFTRQIKSYGPSFDWSREINTTDPEYYKWTQWIFLKLFNSFYDEKLDKARPIEELEIPKNLKNEKELSSEASELSSLSNYNKIQKRKYIDSHRLAYEAEMAINWCPSCKIGLANEEVVNNACERCGTPAEKKIMKQWMLRITKYADRLIRDLETVDYLEKIKTQQVNWIGKSEGATVKFSVINGRCGNSGINTPPTPSQEVNSSPRAPRNDNVVEVFTTRPDTLFGCTYMVLSPEHPLIKNLESEILNLEEVKKYIEKAKNKSDLDRTDLAKEKTGVELKGIKAINPANNEEIPIWIADYVLASYGTGAIMSVPAHDERDFEFAKKFGIEIKPVIKELIKQTDAQKQTLESYNNNVNKYFEKTISEISGEFKSWLDYILSLVNKDYAILEVGSGTGKDADYMESLGYKVERTDGSVGFINYQRSKGKSIKILDLINDKIDYLKYNFIFANAVLLHFDEQQTKFILKKISNGLKKNGILAFSVREGKGEEITNRKIGADRYFRYWSIDEIKKILNNFPVKIIKLEPWTDQRGVVFLWVVVKKKTDSVDLAYRGISVNSDFLNGLETVDAKKQIVTWLEKNNFGKKAVNYKLRDWIFSRQHYWGEPIPIVKCEECGLKDLKIKMELNFRLNEVWNQIIDGKKTIETRALNPEEKNKYFGDIKAGDIIKFSNKNTGEFEIVKINKIYNFKNLEELFKEKDLIEKIIPETKISNIKDLKKAFSFTENYLDRIEKNGLVGWEFEIINTTENISLSEKDLPLELPNVKNYEPTDTGESPLANIDKWVDTKCPKCGGNAKRETDTMPNWAGSSWYFLRYLDPKNNKEFASEKNIEYWMPVDLYNGGMEHTTLHLLYSRFWHKFLFDLGYVNTPEPYAKRRSHGMILAEDGQKMSKSRGNVVNPDDVIKQYGADTIRLYEMFIGPYGDAIPWSTNSLIGMNRFLERVWNMQNKVETRFIASKPEIQTPQPPLSGGLSACDEFKNTILVATNNQGKLKELKEHLKNFNIISLKDIDKSIKEPKENGKTFAENSLIKAKYYAQKTGYLTIADDSGLCVNALDGRPGVFSSRYAEGDDKKGCEKLIKELENKTDRSAYYECVITIYNSKNDKYGQFNGRCEGEILEKPCGTGGFGYDPIFMPKGLGKSFGECSFEDKYKYDHRKQAIDKLIEYLEKDTNQDQKIEQSLHKTIKKVTEDIENLKFNTAISALMVLANEIEKQETISNVQYSIFLILFSPFAPHATEELWEMLGNKESVHLQPWPKYDSKLIIDSEINLVIQINGKLRDQIKVPADISEDNAKKLALESEKIQKWIEGKEIRKIIFVKGKLINLVV